MGAGVQPESERSRCARKCASEPAMEMDENRWESVVVIVVVEERSGGWEPAELAWLGLGADPAPCYLYYFGTSSFLVSNEVYTV